MNVSFTNVDYYRYEPLVLKITQLAGDVTLDNLTIDSVTTAHEAKFAKDSDNSVLIDLRDIRRVAKASFSFKVSDGSTTKTIQGNCAGDYDPVKFIIPLSRFSELARPYLTNPELNAQLPNMITGSHIQVEYIVDKLNTLTPSAGVSSYTQFGIFQLEQDTKEVVYEVNGDIKLALIMRQPECNHRYMRVSWRSRTGKRKVHMWEVVNVTENAPDRQEINNLSQDFDVRKNKSVTLTLRLQDLDAYDAWYYADIITSQDVQAWEENTSQYIAVDVLTKSVTIPNSNAGHGNVLEIEITYKNYDNIG